jgi:hypothetical protein
MVLCCQQASDAGIEAATAPARVSTNMEVINGALRTVREPQPAKSCAEKTYSAVTGERRKQLYLEAFETIEAYNDAVTKAIVEGGAADETLVQVIHSFVSGLGHLYDCSRSRELAPESVDLRFFERSGDTPDPNGDLEFRFIHIINTMLVTAGGYSTSRFLNQGQRVSLNLLRAMATNSSAVAFKQLIDLAQLALFHKRSESTSDKVDNSLLSYDASDAVSGEVMKDSVSNDCKAFVLYEVLSVFLRHQHDDAARTPITGQRYENFIPVVVAGLVALTKLTSDDPFALKVSELVWGNFTHCLSRLLSPTTSEDGTLRIENAPDLILIITAAAENVTGTYVSELCTVITCGASKAWAVAKQYDERIRLASASENEKDAYKDHRDEMLKLFQLCYSVSCRLQPEDAVLKSITREALSDTFISSAEDNALQEFNNEVASIICRCLEKSELQSLVISVFPQLSRLSTVRTASIREAVSEVFNVVDVAAILETARQKYEASEERAQSAEQRVKELSTKVKQLQQRNVELTEEVAVLQASSAM